jgi:hypothetical protein
MQHVSLPRHIHCCKNVISFKQALCIKLQFSLRFSLVIELFTGKLDPV